MSTIALDLRHRARRIGADAGLSGETMTTRCKTMTARRRSRAALCRVACAAAGWLALAVAPLHAEPPAGPPPGDYRVVGGKVDRGTFTGWRLFHSACYGCHGVDAVGTDLAPNLVERIKMLTPRAFATKVLTSYRLVLPASEANTEDRSAVREAMIAEVMRQERGARGQIIMPAWEADPKVNPHVLDLFAYLSARADGKLGPGKPGLLAEKRQPAPR